MEGQRSKRVEMHLEENLHWDTYWDPNQRQSGRSERPSLLPFWSKEQKQKKKMPRCMCDLWPVARGSANHRNAALNNRRPQTEPPPVESHRETAGLDQATGKTPQQKRNTQCDGAAAVKVAAAAAAAFTAAAAAALRRKASQGIVVTWQEVVGGGYITSRRQKLSFCLQSGDFASSSFCCTDDDHQ